MMDYTFSFKSDLYTGAHKWMKINGNLEGKKNIFKGKKKLLNALESSEGTKHAHYWNSFLNNNFTSKQIWAFWDLM